MGISCARHTSGWLTGRNFSESNSAKIQVCVVWVITLIRRSPPNPLALKSAKETPLVKDSISAVARKDIFIFLFPVPLYCYLKRKHNHSHSERKALRDQNCYTLCMAAYSQRKNWKSHLVALPHYENIILK